MQDFDWWCFNTLTIIENDLLKKSSFLFYYIAEVNVLSGGI